MSNSWQNGNAYDDEMVTAYDEDANKKAILAAIAANSVIDSQPKPDMTLPLTYGDDEYARQQARPRPNMFAYAEWMDNEPIVHAVRITKLELRLAQEAHALTAEYGLTYKIQDLSTRLAHLNNQLKAAKLKARIEWLDEQYTMLNSVILNSR